MPVRKKSYIQRKKVVYPKKGNGLGMEYLYGSPEDTTVYKYIRVTTTWD